MRFLRRMVVTLSAVLVLVTSYSPSWSSIFANMIWFQHNSATVDFQYDSKAESVLRYWKSMSDKFPTGILEISGHTDRTGTDEYNLALSIKRAEAVKALLVKFGAAPDRLVTVGRGEVYLLVPTRDGVAEPPNRRVEIRAQPRK
jgi:outer membrane protein OmpA-like peptidoglycan-associated protein